jgi:23S rRNA (cytosine1962-C5)-methyltransferase
MPDEQIPSMDESYRLLDSGDGEKLERFGQVLLRRPSPQVLWPRTLEPAIWDRAWATYHRSHKGGGRWEQHRPLPETWICRVGSLRFALRPTGFGHIGVFSEQEPFWDWIEGQCRGAERALSLLNLFAYTGGSTLAAIRAGATVTHCDASRGVVAWASDNARLNGLGEDSIRWIVDDVHKFLRREKRRGHRYDAIVLDPPSFGRGPKGEVWKLEAGIGTLLEHCVDLLSEGAAFLLLSAHTPGIGPLALRNLVRAALDRRPDLRVEEHCLAQGEMRIRPAHGHCVLPSGTWVAWSGLLQPAWPVAKGSVDLTG